MRECLMVWWYHPALEGFEKLHSAIIPCISLVLKIGGVMIPVNTWTDTIYGCLK